MPRVFPLVELFFKKREGEFYAFFYFLSKEKTLFFKKKEGLPWIFIIFKRSFKAWAGVEPTYMDLQSSA